MPKKEITKKFFVVEIVHCLKADKRLNKQIVSMYFKTKKNALSYFNLLGDLPVVISKVDKRIISLLRVQEHWIKGELEPEGSSSTVIKKEVLK